MLEALVSSRIRRTLLEHLLTHPHGRFYLRGLAKDLGLSVSPLRRELKRLEHTGLLKTFHEANILFYTVNTSSPDFLQLQRAGSPVMPAAPQPQLPAQATVLARLLPGQAIPVGVIAASPESPRADTVAASVVRRAWRAPLRGPVLVGVAAVGMMLMLVMSGIFYLTMTHGWLASAVQRVLAARTTEVTVVAPATPSTGVMRGSRWQIVPGGFGGFSSGVSNESY